MNPWCAKAIGCLASSVAAYYSVHLVLTLLGQPTVVFSDYIGLTLTVSVLFATGFIGLLVKYYWIPFIVITGLGLVILMPALFYLTGPLLPFVRQVIGYIGLPMVTGVYLGMYLRFLKR